MKPLLAYTVEDTSALKYPLFASVKLDGIRCLVIDGVAYSRNMKPIKNEYVQKCIGKPEYNGLDGELIVGGIFAKDCYRQTNSGVMSKDGEPDFKFYVFDRWDRGDSPYVGGFYSGNESVLPYVLSLPFCCFVSQTKISSESELLHYERELLEKGAEGVMVRSVDGIYKNGRSTAKDGILGKVKRMVSAEARITEVIELEHNLNEAVTNKLGLIERSSHKENKVAAGTMGALVVQCIDSGVSFNIGTGFTAEDRNWFWANRDQCIGMVVTYNHFPIGRKDLPRFPSYKGVRSLEDL